MILHTFENTYDGDQRIYRQFIQGPGVKVTHAVALAGDTNLGDFLWQLASEAGFDDVDQDTITLATNLEDFFDKVTVGGSISEFLAACAVIAAEDQQVLKDRLLTTTYGEWTYDAVDLAEKVSTPPALTCPEGDSCLHLRGEELLRWTGYGDVASVAWPLQGRSKLRAALYDARETGVLPANTTAVTLPDGSLFSIEEPNFKVGDGVLWRRYEDPGDYHQGTLTSIAWENGLLRVTMRDGWSADVREDELSLSGASHDARSETAPTPTPTPHENEDT